MSAIEDFLMVGKRQLMNAPSKVSITVNELLQKLNKWKV